MNRILKWNGNDIPEELRSLPAGRYVVEALDETPALTPEEEEGLVEALRELDKGEGEPDLIARVEVTTVRPTSSDR
jgi:hypothetical protein